MSRWQIEPLGAWNRPVTAGRRSSGVFRASWDATLRLLIDEADELGLVGAIAVRVDADEADVRRDGMLRARARVDFPGVVVSFVSRHGPVSFATDAYEQRYASDLPGWQANVRAVALSLGALRAVDRYGVTRSGEQYVGWRALPAGGADDGFVDATAALRWLEELTGLSGQDGARVLLRAATKLLHPDVAGDQALYARLDKARRLLDPKEVSRAGR